MPGEQEARAEIDRLLGAAGVIKAKKIGTTLTGVEVQSTQYMQDVPAGLPAWRKHLPFVYESAGAEIHRTNGLDPGPCALIRTATGSDRTFTASHFIYRLVKCKNVLCRCAQTHSRIRTVGSVGRHGIQ